jgi:acid phosphatase
LKHGEDLRSVYHDLLGFIPDEPSADVLFRVTNNAITSQVASMVIAGLYPNQKGARVPLRIQPVSIDSLEPKYTCKAANSLYANFSVGSKNPVWTTHLVESQTLIKQLDTISGVSPLDSDFHVSFDHYFDNLSSRQCHSKPLPYSAANRSQCISQAMADAVYRLGQYEYSYIHRGAPESLQAAIGYYGVWIAELAGSIRDAVSGNMNIKYRHNIAHDGSLARVLSILQVDVMVWPGMGSEVVFEVYKVQNNIAKTKFAVRVLWGGVPLKSSNPSLGLLDMVDLDVLLGYFDGLVGVGASKVVQFCAS